MFLISIPKPAQASQDASMVDLVPATSVMADLHVWLPAQIEDAHCVFPDAVGGRCHYHSSIILCVGDERK
jgi:hypothetical protein